MQLDLFRGQGWEDETVANVDGELIAGAPARSVTIKTVEQAALLLVFRSKVESTSCNSHIEELGFAPDRVDPGFGQRQALVKTFAERV